MRGWPDRRLLDLAGAEVPIVQAPMAGAGGVALAVAAIRAGAVGSLPCAMLTPEQALAQAREVRAAAAGPLNLNFFCHALPPPPDETEWRALLAPYYAEEGVSPGDPPPLRMPFDAAMADVVEAVRPEIVSFHFGLPEPALLARVRGTGAKLFASATDVREAVWLAERGCDAVIAQGSEAGGHAGWFLDRHRPTGLVALVRQLVAAVEVPVIAAGGVADAHGMAAALLLGASGVQLGTAYLATPESLVGPWFRALLGTPAAEATAFANVFTGRAARGIVNRLIREQGPMSPVAPPFPYAANAVAPLRAAAEAAGRGDFSPMLAGQAAALARPVAAQALTEQLAQGALALLGEAR